MNNERQLTADIYEQRLMAAKCQDDHEAMVELIAACREELELTNYPTLHYWIARTCISLALLMPASAKKEQANYVESGLEAIELALRDQKNNPDFHLAKSALCGLMVQLQPAKAIFWGPKANQSISRAEELGAKGPFYHVVSGRAAFFKPTLFGGSKEKALEQFELAVQAEANDPELLTWQAIAMAENGQKAESRTLLDQIISRWPEYSQAKNAFEA